MNIGIIGSGIVARTLAAGFADKGHYVVVGTRSPGKLSEWLATAGPNVTEGSFADAVRHGEVVIISVNAENTRSAIEISGRDEFRGKVVIDVSNPMDFSQGIPPRFTATVGNSLGEKVQRELPEAFVVKAFNSMGFSVMTEPLFNGEAGTHFIAGNDDDAKSKVAGLLLEFGWEVVDVGEIDQAFFLEALASLWVNFSIKSGQREQAFKLLTR
ncbi:MAG: NAD(P)-binding domain-containing protein [Blastocatellia bacterium]|nr:NAD(P)-binding domain-containing protein [Blastocatellia bacterium]